MTKYFALGIGLKRFVSSPLITGAKPGLSLYAPNYADVSSLTYLADYSFPAVSVIIAEAPLKPSQALSGAETDPSTGLSFAIAETIGAPIQSGIGSQSIAATLSESPSKPAQSISAGVIFVSTIAESPRAPVQAIAGTETDPAVPGASFGIAQAMPAPVQAMTGAESISTGLAEYGIVPAQGMTARVSISSSVTQSSSTPAESLTVEASSNSGNRFSEVVPPPSQAILSDVSVPDIIPVMGGFYSGTPARGWRFVARIGQSSPAPTQGIRAKIGVIQTDIIEDSAPSFPIDLPSDQPHDSMFSMGSFMPAPSQRLSGKWWQGNGQRKADEEALLLLFSEVA